jgi:chromosome segregation ATPase
MRLIGGSPETIKNHLKQLGYPAPIIESTPNLPESLLKVWKSSVHEHTRTVRTECDELLGEMAEQLMIKDSVLTDYEDQLKQKDDLIVLLRKERDEAFGALLNETQAHERTRTERDALRGKVELAEIALVRSEHELRTAHESSMSADSEREKANSDLHRVEQMLEKKRIENANLKGLLDSRMQGFEDGGGDAFPPDSNGKGFPG